MENKEGMQKEIVLEIKKRPGKRNRRRKKKAKEGGRDGRLTCYETIGKVTIQEFKEKYAIAYQEFLDRKTVSGRNKLRFTVEDTEGKLHELRTKSLRYQLFYREIDRLKCVTCGMEGTYFLIQKSIGTDHKVYHANLYGIDKNGEEMMLTKDHIIRRRDGGPDHPDNMQVMCGNCNWIVKN